MVEIVEGSLSFQFGVGLNAIKFDKTDWHLHQMRSSLKAMDILANNANPDLTGDRPIRHWWIEIKNCLGDEAANQTRMAPTDLPEVKSTSDWIKQQGWEAQVAVRPRKMYIIDELIAKLRDTLASMNLAALHADPELAPFLLASRQNLTIVLIISWELNDFKRLAKALQTKLERALQPYGLQGFVVGEHGAVPGLPCTIKRH
ncbi:MAG: hypothetical protein RL748_3449 [Pseudomonadota bacterium]|jgi:hypothetical protein